MAPLSRELAGIILSHEDNGSHPDAQGKIKTYREYMQARHLLKCVQMLSLIFVQLLLSILTLTI